MLDNIVVLRNSGLEASMLSAPSPADEESRLACLRELQILDTEPEHAFDNLTRLTSRLLGTPVVLISLIDDTRQWFKSSVGLDACSTPKEYAFCAHAILEDDVFVIPNATLDERFFDNPLVTDAPYVIAYAGAQLVSASGHKLGTLCAIDHKPREFTQENTDTLAMLAHQVSELIELRLHRIKSLASQHTLTEKISELTVVQHLLMRKNQELERFAYHTSHDLKAPLVTSQRLIDFIGHDLNSGEVNEAVANLGKVKNQLSGLQYLVENLLDLVKADAGLSSTEPTSLHAFMDAVAERVEQLLATDECSLKYELGRNQRLIINVQRTIIVLTNLISNAVKYRDPSKPKHRVVVRANVSKQHLTLVVSDNGPGISLHQQASMYTPFTRFHPELAEGSGLGLAIAKQHVDRLNGAISVQSSSDGTQFTVELPVSKEG